jgi:cytochrome P450
VLALAPMVEDFVKRTMDEMADAGSDGGVIDLRDLFALPLPVAVIAALLGVPEQDWLWLRGLATDLTPLVDFFAGEAEFDLADAAADVFVPYFEELAERRRREPADDMISGLVARQDGDALTGAEVVQTVLLLFVAGFETSVNLLTNGALALLQHPDQLALFRADPSLAEGVVEESLRYDAPVQGASRIALADGEIAGVRVRRGREIWTLLGAANRDPGQFADPDRFDITRAGTKVATFGFGAHFCLGAPLARLEARVAFTALVERFPGLALAGERERRVNFNLRGFTRFPVTVR